MRSVNKYKLFILAIVFVPLMVSRARADFGTSGWEIFRQVQSTQFSGISVAAPSNGDISGMLYNPAMLGTTRAREISLISEDGLDDDKFGSVIYTEPLKNSMIAAAVAYFDAGQVELNWLDNGVLKSNTVSAEQDMLAVIAFEHQPCRWLSVGVSLKAASSELAQQYNAYAYAADVGMMVKPTSNFSISVAAQNLGTATKFIDQADPLPTGIYAGCGYMVRSRSAYFLPTVGVTYLINDEESIPEAGIEVGCGCISLNAGYRNYPGESNMQIGVGIVWGSYKFGYAFLPGNYLDSVQRLSIGYQFKSPQFLK